MSSNDLFFINPLSRALQAGDLERSLSNAFSEIREKGSQARYAQGFRNFELFMDRVYSRHEMMTTDFVRQLIVELATGTFEGTAEKERTLLEIIRSRPEWQAEYDASCRWQTNENLMQDSPIIGVFSNKGLVGERTFDKMPDRKSFAGIFPGSYKIKLVNTGWVIWEGELTAEELILSEAHGYKNLRLAAETEGIQEEPKEKDLLNNGELILRTYPGRESGSIEIELTK